MIIENTIPFGGFYESIHQFDDECEIEYINEQREEKGLGPIDFDDLEVDYKAYELDYSKQYVEKFLEELKNDTEICEMIGLKSIKFESLYSPRQYNFSTDEITVKYNLDNKIFKDFIEKSWEAIKPAAATQKVTLKIIYRENSNGRWFTGVPNFPNFIEKDGENPTTFGFDPKYDIFSIPVTSSVPENDSAEGEEDAPF